MDKLKSRKLLATLSTVLLVVLNRKLGLGLDAVDVGTIASVTAAYCIGQGFVDAKLTSDKVAKTAAHVAV